MTAIADALIPVLVLILVGFVFKLIAYSFSKRTQDINQ